MPASHEPFVGRCPTSTMNPWPKTQSTTHPAHQICRDLDPNTCPDDGSLPKNILDATIGSSFCCRVAAMPIRSFIGPGAFGPEEIAAMSEAFEAALKELHDAGQSNVVREVIGGRIICSGKTW
jgi:hypothetical protein